MGPEECLESQALRVTEALMAFPVCLVRRDTGGRQDHWDHLEPLERMDREARMERSGQGDWLERVVLEVCLGPAVHPVPLDSLV